MLHQKGISQRPKPSFALDFTQGQLLKLLLQSAAGVAVRHPSLETLVLQGVLSKMFAKQVLSLLLPVKLLEQGHLLSLACSKLGLMLALDFVDSLANLSINLLGGHTLGSLRGINNLPVLKVILLLLHCMLARCSPGLDWDKEAPGDAHLLHGMLKADNLLDDELLVLLAVIAWLVGGSGEVDVHLIDSRDVDLLRADASTRCRTIREVLLLGSIVKDVNDDIMLSRADTGVASINDCPLLHGFVSLVSWDKVMFTQLSAGEGSLPFHQGS